MDEFLRKNPTLVLVDPKLPYAETYGGADAVSAYLAATNYVPILDTVVDNLETEAKCQSIAELLPKGECEEGVLRDVASRLICIPMRVPGYIREPYNTERYFLVRVFEQAGLRHLPVCLGRDFFAEEDPIPARKIAVPQSTTRNSEKGKEAQVFLSSQEKVSLTEMTKHGLSIRLSGKDGPHLLPGVAMEQYATTFAVVDLHPFSATNTRVGGNNTNPWDVCVTVPDHTDVHCRRQIHSSLQDGICLLSFDKMDKKSNRWVKRDALCTRRVDWLPQSAVAKRVLSVVEIGREDALHFFDVCFGQWRQIPWQHLRAVRSKQVLRSLQGEEKPAAASLEDGAPSAPTVQTSSAESKGKGKGKGKGRWGRAGLKLGSAALATGGA